MALFPLESFCPTGLYGSVTLSGRQLYGRLVTVSSWVIERQLFLCINVPSCKQRQPGDHRVHTDRLHVQVGLAGVVEKAAYVSHHGRVHKRLGDGARARVLPYSNDVVIVLRSLGKLSASSLVKTDDLPCILAHKHPAGDWLQCPDSPAPVLGAVNLQPDSRPHLHHPVRAGVAAGAEGIALKHGWAVTRFCPAEVQQRAGGVVRQPMCPQAGAALCEAGVGEAGAPRKGDLAGVNSASWPLDIFWRILKNDKDNKVSKPLNNANYLLIDKL